LEEVLEEVEVEIAEAVVASEEETEEVLVVEEIHEEVIAEAVVATEEMYKCMKLFVAIVERSVKFLSAQQVENRFIVRIVSVKKEDVTKVALHEEILVENHLSQNLHSKVTEETTTLRKLWTRSTQNLADLCNWLILTRNAIVKVKKLR
jgi:hypothetical protein